MNVKNIADSYNFNVNLLWYFMLILARKPGKDELGPMFTFLKLKYQEQKVWYVLTSKLESNLLFAFLDNFSVDVNDFMWFIA